MAQQVDYVISTRRVSSGQFSAEPGPTRFLQVPRTASRPLPSMEIRSALWAAKVRDRADGMADDKIGQAGDVLLFVHGYNNDLDIIMKRQRQLQADLSAEGWRGVVVAFDWPSDNSTLNYLEDRSDAAAVAVKLVADGVTLLAKGQDSGCKTNLHLIGHSTGAYVILEAFAEAQKIKQLYRSEWRVAQCAFIGGDVSAASLSVKSDWAGPMYERIARLTNYQNPFDSVLGVSNAKRLGTSPRSGRVGLPPGPLERHPKSTNVNCGAHFQTLDPKKQVFFGTFNHSWHIGDRVFARDLAMTLEGSIDRNALPTRRRVDGELILVDGVRPQFQKDWNLEHSPRVAVGRGRGR
jgi:pimeloyl-ACP methyl ester carboxylesterase